jgi:hypothetical protein
MKFYRLIAVLACMTLILAACYLPGSGETPSENGGAVEPADPAAATAQAETRIAVALAATMTAMAPVAPPATDTPSIPPTPQPTATSSVPTLTVSVATNCRTGPGQAYPIVGAVNPGETAEIVARDTTGNYWVVREPGSPSTICWAWGQYATITGNTGGLPVYDPPPTPTPAVTFAVSYLGVTNCPPQYAFRFQISNTGSLTWESIRIVVTDNTTATTFNHSLDGFRSYNGCNPEPINQDLMPGESGVAANINPGQMNYDPTGHSITATITVCSANGLGGTCLSQTLNFTP